MVNLSVWEGYDALHGFVYRGPHGRLVRRQREWLLPTSGPTTALWWIRAGERPEARAALARLTHLRTHGSTPRAFGVRRRFGPDGRPVVTTGARRRSPGGATQEHGPGFLRAAKG